MPRPREKGHRVAMRGVNRDLSLYPTPWAEQLSVLRGVADASERIPRSFARAGEIKHPNFFFFAWFYFTKAVSFLKRRLIFLNKEEVYRILFSHALQPQTEPSPGAHPVPTPAPRSAFLLLGHTTFKAKVRLYLLKRFSLRTPVLTGFDLLKS